MFKVLIQAILASAVLSLGIDLAGVARMNTGERIRFVRAQTLRMARIDWRPISVFPEEARRFRGKVGMSAHK